MRAGWQMRQGNQQIGAMIRTEARGGKPAETTWKGAVARHTSLPEPGGRMHKAAEVPERQK
jgi:hypothetical protein